VANVQDGSEWAFSSPRAWRLALWSDLKANREKPPRMARRLFVWMGCASLPLDGVAVLPVFAFRGHELELHPLRDRAAEVPSHRMRQPAGSFHWLFQRSAIRPPQQAQDLGCLTTLAGAGGGFGLFGGLLAFGPTFGRAGLLSRLWLAGRNTALVWRNVGRIWWLLAVAPWRPLACWLVLLRSMSWSISWYGKCRIQDIHPSDVAAGQATLCDKTLTISLISSVSFPNM
jgi:hypothetical protein